jgi:hypothetical protein
MVCQHWSRDKVVREIRRLSVDGQDLRHSEVADKQQKLVSASVRYFGSWGAAVTAAGIDYTAIRRKSQSARSQKVTKWSRDRIAGEIKGLVDTGENLAAATARSNHPALFSAAVSPRYFGSWRDALTSLGVDYDSLLSSRHPSAVPTGETRRARTVIRRLRVLSRGSQPLGEGEARLRYRKFYEQAVAVFGTWDAAVAASLDQAEPDAGRAADSPAA